MADRLGPLAHRGNPAAAPLPRLWLFTDPDRLPDPLAAAQALPTGSGVVLRTFGSPAAEARAPALAELARWRGLLLLVGENEGLAERVGADGVHLPQRRLEDLPDLRARRPSWRLTATAHDLEALVRAERVGAEAAFVSPVFPSASPSAGAPLGPQRLGAWVRRVRTPVYALGGVTASTAEDLVGTGVAGLAAIDALRT